MDWNFAFFINSLLLGVGLAMDAFSVSLVSGMNEPQMKRKKAVGIAALFAGFQGAMPLLGWVCVHTVLQYFSAFSKAIPYIALGLLAFIGGKMILDGVRKQEEEAPKAGIAALLLQGIATSIDALSVGFTIAAYNALMAAVAALLIAAVTFAVCYLGVWIGKKFGTALSNKAQIFGGVILVLIGLEIFISSFF